MSDCFILIYEKMALNALERRILSAVQHGLPLSRTPYEDLAEQIGISTEELLRVLRRWQEEGKIRRSGAIVNHFQMGRGVGAMVVWKVPDDKVDGVGELFASFSEISHAYLRPAGKQWPYNLYTMVHASDESELKAAIQKMSEQSGIEEFRVLKTVRELKKVPPTYIVEP